MKNKQLLLVALIGYTIVNTSLAMEKELTPSEAFSKESNKLYRQYKQQQIKIKQFHEAINHLCRTAIASGVPPSAPMNFGYPKHDIMAYALTNNNESLVEYCFEHGHSPNNVVLYHGKNVPALKIAPAQFWSLFKKYNANFNVLVKHYDTLLHRSIWDHEDKTGWLIEETQLDINQPNGSGNTPAHTLAEKFYIGGEKNEAQFNSLAKNGFNPFQKNNDNQTPKEIAQKKKELYEKNQSIFISSQSASQIVLLLEEYEEKYLQSKQQRNTQKHCYCQTFANFNKKPFSIESQDFTPEKIIDAYTFFPQDSHIGFFCKQNPTNSDSIIIAKHYISFNNVYHLTQRRCNNWNQTKELEKKKQEIIIQHNILTEQIRNMPIEEQILLLAPEIQEQFKKIDQMSFEEENNLYEILEKTQEDKFGITLLTEQLNNIRTQLKELENEKVLKKEKQGRKKIQGYYSALDFDVCLGSSPYHQAVKNLLAMLTDHELRVIEASKINEGLHNAYHNKKQS